jgi:hypothetical protein
MLDEPFSVRSGVGKLTPWGDSMELEEGLGETEACRELLQSVGMTHDGLLAVPAPTLVEDVPRFQRIMEAASGGGFLGEEVGPEASETAWLRAKGEITLGEFLANKLELVLVRSWRLAQGGGQRPHHKVQEAEGCRAGLVRFVARDLDRPSSTACVARCVLRALGRAARGGSSSRDQDLGGAVKPWAKLADLLSCIEEAKGCVPAPEAAVDYMCSTPLLLCGTVGESVRREALEALVEARAEWHQAQLLALEGHGHSQHQQQQQGSPQRDQALSASSPCGGQGGSNGKRRKRRKKQRGHQQRHQAADPPPVPAAPVSRVGEDEAQPASLDR